MSQKTCHQWILMLYFIRWEIIEFPVSIHFNFSLISGAALSRKAVNPERCCLRRYHSQDTHWKCYRFRFQCDHKDRQSPVNRLLNILIPVISFTTSIFIDIKFSFNDFKLRCFIGNNNASRTNSLHHFKVMIIVISIN